MSSTKPLGAPLAKNPFAPVKALSWTALNAQIYEPTEKWGEKLKEFIPRHQDKGREPIDAHREKNVFLWMNMKPWIKFFSEKYEWNRTN